VGERRLDDLAGGWCGDCEAVKVPLTNCCGGGGTLDAGTNGEGPEVDLDEEEAKEPGAGVYDEQVFGVGNMAPKEDAGEHAHPDPGPCNDAQECYKTNG